MRKIKFFPWGLFIITLFLSGCGLGLGSGDNSGSIASTKKAVGSVLEQMGKGFAIENADTAAGVYSDHAQWLNAFGDWRVGRILKRFQVGDLRYYNRLTFPDP
ncbi:MAG TPA: hypothetical protein VKA34_00310 [Balneolales bacterium]|nr:hypothetical protein [Balneolales bacterium]